MRPWYIRNTAWCSKTVAEQMAQDQRKISEESEDVAYLMRNRGRNRRWIRILCRKKENRTPPPPRVRIVLTVLCYSSASTCCRSFRLLLRAYPAPSRPGRMELGCSAARPRAREIHSQQARKYSTRTGTVRFRTHKNVRVRILCYEYRKNLLDSALIINFWGWAITLNDILIIIFAPGRYVHLFTKIFRGCLRAPRAGLSPSRYFLGTYRH